MLKVIPLTSNLQASPADCIFVHQTCMTFNPFFIVFICLSEFTSSVSAKGQPLCLGYVGTDDLKDMWVWD